MANVDIDELIEKQTNKVVELANFAEKLGETKGKLDALDATVKHNCQRNEENFREVRGDFNRIDTQLLNYVESNGKVVSALKTKNATKLTFILTMIGISILAFLGGNIIKWSVIDNFFDKTSVSERAEMVKQGIEVGIEAAEKLK